jgi:hypothetical protein
MMWVERGRGALVAVAEPEAAAGDAAAQAFERLGAEVTILRRAMESLAAAVVEARPVDPTSTLEALAARLERVEARLRSVEEQPALAQTAEKQRAGVEGVVEASLRAPLQALEATTRGLAGLVQSAREQFAGVLWWQVAAAALGVLLLGMVAGAFLTRGLVREVVRTGDAAALQALGETDQWKAGLGLMERASPGAYTAMVEAWRLGQWGGAELKGCAGSVQKTGKEVKCTVTLKPPAPPGR